MKRRYLLAAMAFFTACNKESPSITANAIDSVTEGPTCESEIAAWQVSLTDFRQKETTRQASCDNLNQQQIALNDQFQGLRRDWPASIAILRDCFHEAGVTVSQCWTRVTAANILTSTDADELLQQMKAIEERQQTIFNSAKANQCTFTLGSNFYGSLGVKYDTPSSPAPTAPPKPTCAGGSTPEVSNAMDNSNAM